VRNECWIHGAWSFFERKVGGRDWRWLTVTSIEFSW
jgi:hypothetical protein